MLSHCIAMKLLTAIFAVLYLGISVGYSGIPIEFICIAEVPGMSIEEIGEAVSNYVSEDNEPLGKFLLCLYKGHGAINEDGTINVEGFRKYMADRLKGKDSEEVNHATPALLVEHCKDVGVANARRTAIRLNNCVVKLVTPK